jgi:hypothetical protein
MPTRTFGPFKVVDRMVNTRVNISAGDRVTVTAVGEVDFGGAVAGIGAPILTADGDDWQTPSNYPAPSLRKNSLICDVGGTLFQGGVNRSFVSTVAGPLILGVNDRTPEDNSRGWQVTLYHSFPDPPPPGSAPGTPGTVPAPVVGSWLFYTLDGVGGILGPDCGISPTAVLFNNRVHVFYGEWIPNNLRHLDFNPFQAAGAVGSTFGSPPPEPPERDIDILDGDGGPNGRVTDPLGWVNTAVVHNGQIHVFYIGEPPGGPYVLRHATSSDGVDWQFEVLDGAGGPSGRVNGDVVRFMLFNIAAVSAGGELHLFYFGLTDLDAGPGDDGRGVPTGVLRHATLPATGSWRFEVLDGAGGPNGRLNAAVDGFVGHTCSAAVGQDGRIHVFYSNAAPGIGPEGESGITNLRCAWSDNGTNWEFQTIDGRGGSDGRIRAAVGLWPAAIEFEGKIHVFYRDDTHGNVRQATLDGTNWTFQALDGTGGRNGRTKHSVYPRAAARLADRLSIFEHDADSGDLRQAYWMGVNWQFEILDGAFSDSFGRISADVASSGTAIAISPGRYAVFYRDNTNTDLRYADFRPPGS